MYGLAAYESQNVKELSTSSVEIYRRCNDSITEVRETSFYVFFDILGVVEAYVKAYCHTSDILVTWSLRKRGIILPDINAKGKRGHTDILQNSRVSLLFPPWL